MNNKCSIKNKLIQCVFLLFSIPSLANALQCEYSVVSEWDTGFVANISIENASNENVEDWSVTWNFSNREPIAHSWSSTTVLENGFYANSVVASPSDWNSAIAAGESLEFGFIGVKNESGFTAENVELSGDCTSVRLVALQDELNEKLALWESYALESYVMSFGFRCGLCPYPGSIGIEVTGNEIISAYYEDSGEIIPNDAVWPFRLTVQDVFDRIQQAITMKADSIEVQYDDELGFPTLLSVDPSETSYDDQYGYSIFAVN